MNRFEWLRLQAAAAVAVAVCVFASPPAEAGSVYQFAFDQATYQVDPGATVGVNVYLQEQVDNGSTSVLATEGLIGAGVRVSFDLAPLPSDPAQVLGASGVILNDGPGGFTGGYQSIAVSSGSFAELTETVDITSPAVTATDLGGGLFQILLGTFNFKAGAIAGETTLIQAADAPGFLDNVTNDGQVLDGLISAGTARIQVALDGAAVPEPSSWVAMALGMIGVGRPWFRAAPRADVPEPYGFVTRDHVRLPAGLACGPAGRHAKIESSGADPRPPGGARWQPKPPRP